MENYSRYITAAGRILLSLLFLVSGYFKITHWSAIAGMMASKGMPAVPVLLALAIVLEIGGGLALVFGIRPREVGWLLFLYLIPVTLMFHNFWAYQGMEQTSQMANFLKNVGVMGGLLLVTTTAAASGGERRS